MNRASWSWLIALACILAAAGCTPGAVETPIPPIDLDISSVSDSGLVKASAEAVPVQEVAVSFLISGPLKEVKVAEGDLVQAGQTLAVLSSPALEYGLIQAEAAVRAAELDYEYWTLPRTNRPPERRLVAAQELEAVQRTLDTARAELAQTTLKAPFAATVISVDVKPGEVVSPGQVVIQLAVLEPLRIETTDLSELDIPAVQVGQPALVFIDALDEEFPGTVTAISPISNTIGGDVVFKVTIGLDDQPEALMWGMSADVEIDVE